MDRHVIANMGAELGATSTIFPSDKMTREFLKAQERAEDWTEILADKGAKYDKKETIDLATLEPLIAKPSSPGNVVKVREVAGQEIYQAYIGSSANPGFRDFAMSALMVQGKQVHPKVSYDINPSARCILEELVKEGHLEKMIHAGARIHQAGCNGCIGMGQAPATGRNSLRTVPRNFLGRSGTKEDSVFLCSPETATASALKGAITDPRDLGISYPKIKEPRKRIVNKDMLQPPLPPAEAEKVKLIKGPNISSLPPLKPVPDALKSPVLLKLGDNISTDTILPAGGRVLPYRSNIEKIAEFSFEDEDKEYVSRAKKQGGENGHVIVAGKNYGQGSSREHAALAPKFLGLKMVIAKNFARIHWQNLINFGVLPVTFKNAKDYDRLELNDIINVSDLHKSLVSGKSIQAKIENKGSIELEHTLSKRQIDVLLEGGLINWVKKHHINN